MLKMKIPKIPKVPKIPKIPRKFWLLWGHTGMHELDEERSKQKNEIEEELIRKHDALEKGI